MADVIKANSGVNFALINQPGVGKNCQGYDDCTWDSKGDRCRACVKCHADDYVTLYSSGGLTIKQLKGSGDDRTS